MKYSPRSPFTRSGTRSKDYVRKLDALRQTWGGRCVMCGATESKVRWRQDPQPLEFAHVKPTPLSYVGNSRGARARYLDITRHPHCYILVCYNCHRKIDDVTPNKARDEKEHVA